ncbi:MULTISPECIES: hypothetical protein [Pseudomonas]|uniref:hypothetical protein n=1 Tax=Pseudomonas sp. MS-1(2024) TaxID=3112251 RepID=UPI002DBB4097|nr:hypothetical protein [Pseudomonas sp. MS-1(2024)]MEC4169516.1 hypothetical protein [Pseudomonas sp. MS-1(2024)]
MSAYYSTKDLCERFRCSSRTLFRRMKRIENPFPAPCMKHAGSCNLWDADDVFEWEQRERERTFNATWISGSEAIDGWRIEA